MAADGVAAHLVFYWLSLAVRWPCDAWHPVAGHCTRFWRARSHLSGSAGQFVVAGDGGQDSDCRTPWVCNGGAVAAHRPKHVAERCVLGNVSGSIRCGAGAGQYRSGD